MATAEYGHIVFDSQKVPFLSGTRTKVVEIVLDHLAHGSDAHEIHRQYPHLTLGQIHSALAYYYDHQGEMDEEIQERLAKVGQIRSRLGEGPMAEKLQAMGRLP